MIKKQITMSVPVLEWKAVRIRAAKEKISMASLLSSWIKPHLKELKKEKEYDDIN